MTSSMMATKVETVQDWTTVFPDFTTLQGSTSFIKKMIAVSLSSITYIREIFPDHAYGERNVGGLKLKLLTEACNIKAVSKFINMIRSCYDAVEKKYLHQLSVGICVNPENSNEVIEAYKLEFRYKEDEYSITCQNKTSTFKPNLKDPTVKASFQMLKAIYEIDNILGHLPKENFITMKLLYYDDVTPPDYEPPGFEPSPYDKFDFAGKTLNVVLGKVETTQHHFNLYLKSTVGKQSQSQMNADGADLKSSQSSGKKMIFNEENVFECASSSQGSNKGMNLRKMKKDPTLSCPCGTLTVALSNTIICTSCERKQHKLCYGILKEDFDEVFYCVDCIIYNSDGNVHLDLVYKLKDKERQEFCAVRRALILCSTLKFVTWMDLEKQLGCTKKTAQLLMEHLVQKEFLIKVKGKYAVDYERIDEFGMPTYFPSKEDIENCDPSFYASPQYSPKSLALDEENNQEGMLQNSAEIDIENTPNSGYNSILKSPQYSPSLLPGTNLESPIQKVKRLSINKISPRAPVPTKSRKRKASNCEKTISSMKSPIADSDELFQSQKKRRTKRRAR